MGIAIDYSISLGTIVEVGSIVAGGFIALGVLRQAVKDMKEEIKEMEVQIRGFAQALVTLAVQTNRLDNLEREVRDLRRGRGFITERPVGED